MEHTSNVLPLFYREAGEFQRLEDGPEKVELAVSRLENPYHLADDHRLMYQDYLAKVRPEVLHPFVDAGRVAYFPLLIKHRALRRAGVPALVAYAQSTGKMDVLAYLLNVSNAFRTPGRLEVAPKYVPGKSAGGEAERLPEYARIRPGDTLWLGMSPMPWRVLEKREGKVFLLSDYALDCQPFSGDYKPITWEICSLRSWLNGPFADGAFTPEETERLETVYINREDELSLSPSADAFADRVFLLSDKEAARYFKTNEARRARVTAYAADKIMWTFFDRYAHWWLRTKSPDEIGATHVRADGTVFLHGGTLMSNSFDTYFEHYGVRPAICLRLS